MTLEAEGRGTPKPSIDIPLVVKRIKAGDERAFAELDGFLRPELFRYLVRRLPNEAEDLTQDTLSEMYAALPSFEFDLKGKDPTKTFIKWTFTIARANINMELRRIIRTRGVSFEDTFVRQPKERTETTFIDLMPRFKDRLTELLTPAQLKAVELRTAGKGISEIIDELGSTQRAVLNLMYRARDKIEGNLFYPAGFRLLADYQDGSLATAASRGGLEAVKFLGRWYTTDEWVQRYHYKRVTLSTSMLEQGFLPLAEQTTSDEYGTLLGFRYKHLLTRTQGRIYITQEGLNEFRSKRIRAKRRIKSPGKEYQQVSDFPATPAVKNRLTEALASGYLPGVKKGSWWFIKPEDAKEFLTTYTASQNNIRPIEVINSISQRQIELFSAVELENMPENDSHENFRNWFFKTAKAISDHRLPRKKRRHLPQPDNFELAVDIFLRQFNEWLKIREVNLSPYILEIVNLKLQGKKSTDIEKGLDKSEDSITGALSIARKAIENKIIYPAGIKRVASFDKSLVPHAHGGRLDAVWFLGRWYTTDEKVAEYYNNRTKSL